MLYCHFSEVISKFTDDNLASPFLLQDSKSGLNDGILLNVFQKISARLSISVVESIVDLFRFSCVLASESL